MSALTDQIHDRPMTLADLDFIQFQADQLRAAKTTANQQCQHGIVALSAHRRKAVRASLSPAVSVRLRYNSCQPWPCGASPGTVTLSNVAVGLLRREETEEAVRLVAYTGSEEQPTARSSAAVIPKA